MEVNNYVLAGTAAAATIVVLGAIWFAVKDKHVYVFDAKSELKPDLTAFKRSMEDRYKHPESIKLSDEIRKEIMKGIHFNIANDITHLFPGLYHAELNAYNEKLYSKYI